MVTKLHITFKPSYTGVTFNIFESVFDDNSVKFGNFPFSLTVPYKQIDFIQKVDKHMAQAYIKKEYFDTFFKKVKWSFFSTDYKTYALWLSSHNLDLILEEFKKHKVTIR